MGASAKLHVGTSGFRYWPGDVHPPKTTSDDALRLYSAALPSVEINRCFYALPRAQTIAKYRSLVPERFVFAAKIWKRITHEKKLEAVEEDWTLFLTRLRPLVADGGVFLLQLPKRFPFDLGRLSAFLELVPKEVRLAVEFRLDDWFSSPTYQLLEKHQAAIVGVGAPKVPRILNVTTAPFVYFRLHGPREWYKDRYTLDELSPFIAAAQKALAEGLDVYVYFDNTIGGHAYWNALEFREAVLGGLTVGSRVSPGPKR